MWHGVPSASHTSLCQSHLALPGEGEGEDPLHCKTNLYLVWMNSFSLLEIWGFCCESSFGARSCCLFRMTPSVRRKYWGGMEESGKDLFAVILIREKLLIFQEEMKFTQISFTKR